MRQSKYAGDEELRGELGEGNKRFVVFQVVALHQIMKVETPSIAWHNRDRVSSIDFQPKAHPKPTQNGGTRIATGGDDNHVIVRNSRFSRQIAKRQMFILTLEFLIFRFGNLLRMTVGKLSLNVCVTSPDIKTVSMQFVGLQTAKSWLQQIPVRIFSSNHSGLLFVCNMF